ncbi:sensor histidine kinase [Dictyobacter formicarum]|uniref:Histidine kinase/HSP90-like ATPase domain-containing protein n=1 Tax=Dictyobacter formicarum TaxID=2778368 RepID=A0ABQ3VMM0_9CHLR|nr:sensor histidine kinase [Dictyobacter formicarum]GHO86613.1 hypothetical protein KSZ_46190 [Dictyobacter formicarum]
MKEKLFLPQQTFVGTTIRRWFIAVLCVGVQLVLLILLNKNQSTHPEVTLAPVNGRPGICQVLNVTPFTDAWTNNVRVGSVIYPKERPFPPGHIQNCQLESNIVATTEPGGHPFTIHASPQAMNPVDVFIAGILALIFDTAGIAIFFRSKDRPTARVAFILFYVVSLMCSLFGTFNLNVHWASALFINLLILTTGLSTTFVCLFPHPLLNHTTRQGLRWLPYVPLGVGIVLMLLNLVPIWAHTSLHMLLLLLAFLYNIVCVLIVIGILIWGMRHMARTEQQLARMVTIGIIFLLVISSLTIGIVPPMPFFHSSLLHLVPVPLVILPIICDYAIFHHQLLGATSLLSRKVMRVFLWALLSCAFIFPAIIALRTFTSGDSTVQLEWRDYLYAGLMAFSLWLFPLVWNKVRDAGDHVFYHDFYQYNDELRQLSTALTGLRGLDQISAFILPRLEQLLNANEVALFIRAISQDEMRYVAEQSRDTSTWHIYRHSQERAAFTDHRLREAADLALVHFRKRSFEPLLLDSMLLFSLYDGELVTGFLCLGPKQNYEPYSRLDKSFLASLVAQLSVLEVNNRYLTQAQADAQKLMALNHRVIQAQEEERRHLALDLHDDVLQEAMLLVRQLSDARTMDDVTRTLPVAQAVVTDLRRTCLALRPSLLEELGLAEALRWLGRQTEKMGGNKLQVIVYSLGPEPERASNMSSMVELAFYRVAQEALANVVKHAHASRVMVRLRYSQQGKISLVIADNGSGFRLGDPRLESLGIVGMHERMSAISGSIVVRTQPGRGTAVRATYKPGDLLPEEHPRSTILTVPQVENMTALAYNDRPTQEELAQ